MNLSVLSEEELFRLASSQHQVIRSINEEWLKRYQMHFPYQLVGKDIYNSIMEQMLDDADCDIKVIKQANKVRNDIELL